MHSVAYIFRLTMAGTLALFVSGCRDTTQTEKDLPQSKVQERMAKFHARMEQVHASVTMGMSYSQVVASIGQPFLSDTNGASVIAIYRFTPPVQYHSVITNGIQVNFHNGVVVSKSPVQGSRQ